MLPIENENYGILYSFQPDYLAHLIQDDNASEADIIEAPEQREGKRTWKAFASYIFAFMKK
jgi:hypothetical protein